MPLSALNCCSASKFCQKQAEACFQTLDRLGAEADFGAARLGQQLDVRDIGVLRAVGRKMIGRAAHVLGPQPLAEVQEEFRCR